VSPWTRVRGAAVRAGSLYPILAIFVVTSLLGQHFGQGPSDEKNFLYYAHRLVHGHYADRHAGVGKFLWHGPGLPLLVAPLVAVGVPPTAIRLVGPIALFVGAIGMRQLLRRYMPEHRALLGTYAFALYWPFYTVLPQLLSEPLAVALLVWFMVVLIDSLHTGRPRSAIVAGVLFGLLALTRVEFGWVITLGLVAALIWFGVARTVASRQLLLIAAAALAICIPWLAYTYKVSGQAFYWSNSSGLSLYWTASPVSGNLGDWQSEPQVFTDPNLAPHRAFFASLSADPVRQDSQLHRQAIQWIEQQPTNYVRNVTNNASRLVFNTPYSFTPEKLSFLFYAVPNSFLLIGLVVLSPLALRLRRNPASAEDVILALLGVGIFVEHTLVAAYARFFILVIPIVLFFFMRAASSVWDALETRPTGDTV
jgi:hypothetical protein